MQSIIEVFRMNEISPKIRANIIIALGQSINHQYASNITEPLVYELVSILDKDNPILKEEFYISQHSKGLGIKPEVSNENI